MPRRKKDEYLEDLVDDKPPAIEPYTILGIEKTATAEEVKSAYRKAALKHHPDKAPSHLKDTAHTKFQEIACAYAVLSDPTRRKRYDITGSTAESISADDFNWSSFYSEQFRDAITTEAIENFSKQYKGSGEEKDDVLAAYEKYKGKWAGIYESVMLSDPLEDEERYKGWIDEAIEKGDVKGFKGYTEDTEKQKQNRMKAARKEAKEALGMAKELGVDDKLFGKGKGGKSGGGEDALAALIQKRRAGRGDFFDHLEAKYAGNGAKKSKRTGKKRTSEDEDEDGMPSEEAFQAAAAKLKKGKSAGGETEGRKAKRAKR